MLLLEVLKLHCLLACVTVGSKGASMGLSVVFVEKQGGLLHVL